MWLFAVFCGGIVLGLACATTEVARLVASPTWMIVGALVFLFAWWKQWRWLIGVVFVAGCVIGLSRGVGDVTAQSGIEAYIGKTVTVTGRVSEDVDKDKRGDIVLRLDDVMFDGHTLPIRLWVTLDSGGEIWRSDRVTTTGKLDEGFGNFASSMYRAELVRQQRPEPGDVMLRVRDWFAGIVRQYIEEPMASLGLGYLTGQRRSLPPELEESLKLAGLTHIVVASGYNLTILVRMMKRLFEKRSRYLTVFLSGLLIVAFIGITGMSPSMTRAGLVAGLALLAWYFGRRFHPVVLLLFAAAATGLAQPSFVWGNLGWQLSFAAFGGVMVLAPLLQAYFFGNKKPSMIRQIIGETLSAQIATAPIILFAFGQISNVALVANVLILPLVPLAMLGVFFTGLFGIGFDVLAHLVGAPTQWLLEYMVWVATWTANVDWAQTQFELPLWGMIAGYVLIVAACWWMWRASGYRLRSASLVE